MGRIVFAYVATAVVFLVLDGGWLALAGPRLYRPELGSLLAEKVRPLPAVIFYLLFVAGLVGFVVQPSLAAGWTRALVWGGAFGAIAYATYDLTCAATMRTWSVKVTVADIVWGAVASGIASAAATAIVDRFARG
ncbi:MAG: DUF2177 family protein [Caulobacteraceae bacterium]|nr:DUF2177 family protein [Caulobacter sp.]